jgi:membrane fusion protein, multidrug efflux system
MNKISTKVLLTAIVLLIIAAGCGKKTEEKREILRPVKYMVAGTGDARKVRTFSGFARVGNDVTLSFRTAGIIVQKDVTKGQFVKKGKMLGRLDNVEAELAYEKALSELKRAESEMNTTKTNFDRIKNLYEQGAKPLIEYENARNVFQTASSQYETAQRNTDIQKTQLEYAFVYAPMDGIVLKTEGNVNERVDAGHAFVLLNVSDGRMKVTVNLPESVINLISLNMPVQIKFSVIPNKEFTGTIMEISPDVSEESATYPVDIALIDPTNEVKPGMAANVTFDFTEEKSADNNKIILPVKTVGEDASGHFVFIVQTEDGKTGQVIRKKVEIGQLTTDGFEIISGLSEGEKVITAGLQTLLDGQKVSIQ